MKAIEIQIYMLQLLQLKGIFSRKGWPALSPVYTAQTNPGSTRVSFCRVNTANRGSTRVSLSCKHY